MNTVGWCYAGVKQALRKVGIDLYGAAAWEARDQLQDNKRFRVVSTKTLKPGDILVHDKSSRHPYGHIAVYLGHGQEASDHVQHLVRGGGYGETVAFRPTTASLSHGTASTRIALSPGTASNRIALSRRTTPNRIALSRATTSNRIALSRGTASNGTALSPGTASTRIALSRGTASNGTALSHGTTYNRTLLSRGPASNRVALSAGTSYNRPLLNVGARHAARSTNSYIESAIAEQRPTITAKELAQAQQQAKLFAYLYKEGAVSRKQAEQAAEKANALIASAKS